MTIDDKLTVTITRDSNMITFVCHSGIRYRAFIVSIQNNALDLLGTYRQKSATQQEIKE